jgi:Mg-chelatase subunit ChlD
MAACANPLKEVTAMQQHQNGHPESHPHALYVTLILDESGSMNSCKAAAIAGFNQYVATLRREQAETRVTLTLFNSGRTDVRYRGVPVSAVQDLDVETYRPHATTALYDAIGRTLSVARQEAPTEAKKLCVILTDGLENSSHEYTRKQIFDLIKACEKEGWTFLYLGADHDVWEAGESLGVARDNTVSFCKSNISETFTSLSLATARYRRGDSRRRTAPPTSNDPSSPRAN